MKTRVLIIGIKSYMYHRSIENYFPTIDSFKGRTVLELVLIKHIGYKRAYYITKKLKDDHNIKLRDPIGIMEKWKQRIENSN